MNIWFFSAYERPRGHTSRTYDYSLELIKRGHSVTVFANSYDHRTHVDLLSSNEKWRIEEIDGINVVWLKTFHYTGNGWRRGINMISFAVRALQVAKTMKNRPDVVVGDSVPPTAGWAAARIADVKKAAFVFQIRDVWPIALVFDGGLSKYSPIYYIFRFIEKRLYRKAHGICSTIPFLYQHVSESGGNPEKITWVPNGVNLARYKGMNDYRGGVTLPLVAMYVGAFGNAHDVITIVRAANILKQKGNNNYRFIIIGDGVKRAECEREASLLGLSNIQFHDSVAKQDVPKLQHEADIFIACVTDSDAYRFGLNLNKLYDYFASGRPVIFSGRAPKDPVTHSGAGFSIPPENPEAMAEAMERYLEMTPAERIELGAKARKYAETEFDVEKLVDRMEHLLIKAINTKNVY